MKKIYKIPVEDKQLTKEECYRAKYSDTIELKEEEIGKETVDKIITEKVKFWKG